MSREKPGLFETALNLFADVRKGEGLPTVLLGVNLFLIFTAYYMIKPAREALILAGGSAEVKSYAAAGQTLMIGLLLPVYARLAARLPRRGLTNAVILGFAACLPVFYAAAKAGFSPFLLGVVFYLWVGVFNMIPITQIWSFANDLYTPDSGKRLFAIIGFGASAGAVFGSDIAKRLIPVFGVDNLLLVAGAVLAGSLLITHFVEQRGEGAAPAAPETAAQPIGRGEAFRLVWGSRYLLMIAGLILIVNWVNTTGEYILGRTVKDAAVAAVAAGTAGGLGVRDLIGKFYSEFFEVVNVIAMLSQLFLVSRILKYAGISIAILILPVIAFTGYACLAFIPVLAIVRWVKTAENSTDYSLQNTVRHALFLPLRREEKYAAKQVTDAFCWRAGDLLSAVLVFVGTSWLSFGTKHFALVNLALVLLWLILAWEIGRENKRLTAGS